MTEEIHPGARDGTPRIDRRRFLEIAGATIAFSRLVGCTSRPREKIVPYVEQPRGLTPGRSEYFATSFAVDGVAVGLLALSHEGRPTKVEGHPEPPASLGATSAIAQASILGLYDPDRAKRIREGDRPRSYRDFVAAFGGSPRGPHSGPASPIGKSWRWPRT